VGDGEPLGDDAAEGRADAVRLLDAEAVEDREGVRRHVGDRVRVGGEVDGGGAARVPVVVPDDPAAPGDEPPDEPVVPLHTLGAGAHQQQYRRVVGVAELLGPQLEFPGRHHALGPCEAVHVGPAIIFLHGRSG
jgi:hypothetical protein